jgi:hypothetical protein
MCKAFAFRLSAEAVSDKNLIETVDSQVDVGDGFGWIGSTKRPRLTDQEFTRLLPGESPTGWGYVELKQQ